MKTMTCHDLGGPCELEHRAATADEIINAQDKHLRAAVKAGDETHAEAREAMKGRWQTVLLVDGNIGIGGDVAALLTRCRELLRPTGEVVLELHSDASTDRAYTATLIDSDGGCSAQFPWAEVGLDRIAQLAPRHRLALREFWVSEGRSFCRLSATRR